MKTSLKGRIALAVSEGIVDTAYLDSVGVWTLGIGHTVGAGKPNPKDYIGKKMTIPQIMAMFEKDITKYEDIVNRNVKIKLTQNEFDALVHFVYNVGEPNFKKSKLLVNLNSGNKKLAGQSGFHGWLKPPELLGRRDKERDIFLHGKYGSSIAPLYTADTRGKLKRTGTVDVEWALKQTHSPVERQPDDPGIQVPEKKKPSTPPSMGLWEAIANFLIMLFGGKR